VRAEASQVIVPDCEKRKCKVQKKNGLHMEGRYEVSQLALLIYTGGGRRRIGSLGNGR